MTTNQMIVATYLAFWLVRINPFLRRWRQPLLRGPEWFFNVPVQPGFYAGPGADILRRYRMRIFLPFAIDIAAVTVILILGKPALIGWLLIFLVVFIHGNHLFSVDLAQRRARPYAVPGSDKAVPAMALSLKRRRLADYTNRRLEALIALISVGVFLWLARYYMAGSGGKTFREVFGAPLFLLYLQLGVLLVKWGLVAWRTPIPQNDAETHIAWREQARKLYLQVCDWYRISWTAQLLVCPFMTAVSSQEKMKVLTIFWWSLQAITIAMTVWLELRRKALQRMALRASPVRLPNLSGDAESSSWLLCFQPSSPLLLVKSARGYALNLANTRTQFGAVYLAGLVTLVVLLRR